MPFAARILYHVTPVGNVDVIREEGLRPMVGPRSGKLGEPKAIHLFHDPVAIEDALMGWLGQEFDEDEVLSILQVTLPAGYQGLAPGADFEVVCTDHISGAYVSLLALDADDFSIDNLTDRRDAMIEPTEENLALARDFVMDRWVEWRREKFPNRPPPSDLTDACKFSSAFAHRLFGGDIEANESHQFVVLEGGYVVDLNMDASDVQTLESPYEVDPDIKGEYEWRQSMDSIRPRIDGWVERFVAGLSPGVSPIP